MFVLFMQGVAFTGAAVGFGLAFIRFRAVRLTTAAVSIAASIGLFVYLLAGDALLGTVDSTVPGRHGKEIHRIQEVAAGTKLTKPQCDGAMQPSIKLLTRVRSGGGQWSVDDIGGSWLIRFRESRGSGVPLLAPFDLLAENRSPMIDVSVLCG